MVLVGATVTGVRAALASESPPAPAWSRRFSFRTLLMVALPAFVLMRIGAELIRGKEIDGAPNPPGRPSAYTTADGGAFLLIVAIVLAWLAVRRGRPGLARAAAVVAGIAAIGWIITVVMMATKPS
jgi:hypothetical protein